MNSAQDQFGVSIDQTLELIGVIRQDGEKCGVIVFEAVFDKDLNAVTEARRSQIHFKEPGEKGDTLMPFVGVAAVSKELADTVDRVDFEVAEELCVL